MADVYSDRKQHIVVTRPTPIFSTDECLFGQRGQKIATAVTGDKLSVRRIRYEKDCKSVRVRLKSGQEGYL